MLLSPLYTQKQKLNCVTTILLLFVFLYPASAQTYQTQPYHPTKEQAPSYQTQSYQSSKYQTPTYQTQVKQESYEKYPAIDKLEQRILGQVSTSKNIYERLDNLETKVFKQTYNTQLSQRVEHLQKAVGNQNNTAKNSNITKRLAEVENHVFERTYQNDSLNSRLARLESHYFGQTYADESSNNRLDRIYTVLQVEVYKANNTSMPNDVINKTSDGVKVLSIIMFVAGLFL